MQNPEQPIRSREIKNFARHLMKEPSLVGIRDIQMRENERIKQK